MWFTDLLVSHNFTRLSREPETSRCSCEGAHFTAVTQPVWEVRDNSTSEPSGEERRQLIRKYGGEGIQTLGRGCSYLWCEGPTT